MSIRRTGTSLGLQLLGCVGLWSCMVAHTSMRYTVYTLFGGYVQCVASLCYVYAHAVVLSVLQCAAAVVVNVVFAGWLTGRVPDYPVAGASSARFQKRLTSNCDYLY